MSVDLLRALRWSVSAAFLWVVSVGLAGWLAAQEPAPAGPAAPMTPVKPAVDAATDLAQRQGDVADKFKRLKGLMLRMAEFERATNPRRAELLKRAVEESNNRDIEVTLSALATLLNGKQYGKAMEGQKTARADLQEILTMLLKERRDERLKSEQERIKEYLKEVAKLIHRQQALQGQNENGADPNQIAKQQGDLGKATGDLAQKIKANEESKPGEGKPGEGKPGESPMGEQKPGEGKPTEGMGEGKPMPGEGKPMEGMGEGKPGEGKPMPGEGKPMEGMGEGKPMPGEGKPMPGEGKPMPGEGKPMPGEGKPMEGMPGMGEGQPMEGMGQGKPMPGGGMGKPMPGGMGEGEGEGSDSPPPPPGSESENPARKRIEAAQKKMEEAKQKLEKANRGDSIKDQQAAREELELAKQELERILRQLREEEIERTLAALEQRFAAMLEAELKIYEDTQRLNKIPVANRPPEFGIHAGRLSFDQRKVEIEAQKALELLREEGSSIAFPATVEQMIADMDQVAERLGRSEVGTVTIGLEEDIIQALQEMVEALQKAQREAEQRRMEPMPPMDGQPQDQPLVDEIAELKMIKSLQIRVNNRTTRYARLLENEEDEVGQATNAELVDAIRKLAERQVDIEKITRDIVLGKNK